MNHISLGMLLASIALNAAATDNYQDWWWNPAMDGMGWNVEQQRETVVVSWYHYGAAGSPTFLLFYGPLVNNVVQGSLWRSYATPPGSDYDPSSLDSVEVGSASLKFQSSNQATFTYNFDGRSGSLPLQRFTFSQINASGVWDYYQIGEYSGCTLNEINGPFTEAGSVSITQTDNRITLGVRYETGEICTFNLIGTQSGNYVDAIGSFSCNYGIVGNAALNDIRVIDDFLTLRMDLQLTTGETCRQQSDLGAIK